MTSRCQCVQIIIMFAEKGVIKVCKDFICKKKEQFKPQRRKITPFFHLVYFGRFSIQITVKQSKEK